MSNDEEIITQENDTETTENTEETTVEVVEETEEEETETVEELKKRLATAEAQKEHWREKAAKKTEAPSQPTHSLADLRAIQSVHEDDVERVEKWAKDNNVSLREAMKDDELKAILAVRDEKRTTAAATNVAPARRGSTKVSDDVLVANASAGKLPDSDDDIERLIAAKRRNG